MSHRIYIIMVAALTAWIAIYGQSFAQTTIALQRLEGQPNVTVDRDPNNSHERCVLLTPGGPIVVEFAMTINGQPFRMAREKLVDELLDLLKKNDEGQVTWESAVASPRSPLRQFYLRGANAAAVEQLIKQYDVNKDGVVDRGELRQLVGRNNGDAFTVRGNQFGSSPAVAIDELLDANHDKVLSREEIAIAAQRLKSRDEDDNDLVTVAELGGQTPGMYRIANQAAYRQAAGLAMLLGPAADLQAVYNALQEKYHDKDAKLRPACFPLVPKLVEALDTNHNGEFDRDEAKGLDSLAAHLVCEVNLGDSGELPKGLTVQSLAPELGRIEDAVSRSGETATIKLPSLTLSLTVSNTAPAYNFDMQAKSFLDRYDTDKNGYLDKKEVAGQQGIEQQFEFWDADGDGKVYASEIVAANERQMAPSLTQVSVLVADQGTALFSTLDVSGDGKLGVREMRTAAERLKTFDTNGDGQITRDEIPRQFSATIARGNNFAVAGASPLVNSTRFGAAPVVPTKGDWFTSMDRNGDGDISPREFLGTPEQFQKLDANGDGLIDRTEADAKK